MSKNSVNIIIVGGFKAFGVYRSLAKMYQNVRFFRNEKDCLKSFDYSVDILIIDQSLEISDLLMEVRNSSKKSHVIYLSNSRKFMPFLKALQKGANDYILKDSYLYSSVRRAVRRVINNNKNGRFIDTCGLKKSYPIRYRLASWTHKLS
ncbi:MAG: hypothetical protein ACKVJC_07640 [Flavobacteriales bacterium]